jgi:transcriptional regulator with PAS, ATPase and Fis domain
MEYKVLLVSTYSELSEKVRMISKYHNLRLDIYEGGILKNGIDYARQMEHKYDVIISQGGTSAAIKEVVNIPVIDIEINVVDLIAAIYEAKKYEAKICMVAYKSKSLEKLNKLNNFLNIDINILSYTNKRELENQIYSEKRNNKITILGMGNCIEEFGVENNIRTIVIKSSDESIEEALVTAKNIIELGRREKVRAERFKAILDYSDEGIIAFDNKEIITTFNPCAEKIIKLNVDNVLNKPLKGFLDNEMLKDLYGDGKIAYNMLVNIKDTQFIINRVAIIVDNEQAGLVITFKAVSQLQNLERKVRHKLFSRGLYAKYRFEDIKGSSDLIYNSIKKAKKFAETDSTVLIYGETGTGKELFAQSIHNYCNRSNEPFVAINCAALPENILESELFGHEEGAFTGAKKGGKIGVFELAHKGTIFLDEISEIPVSLQGRLLRVLQEKELFRVGGDQVINTDIRVIVATNKKLYKLVKEGKFREDLYFRINILNLILPSLRQRKEDIPMLINEFVAIKKIQFKKNVAGIESNALEIIKNYPWPGNVRELENFVEKVIVLNEDKLIGRELVQEILNEKNIDIYSNSDDTISIEMGSLKEMELQIIEKISQDIGNDKNLLADKLGISRTTLWKRLKELEM